MISLKIGSKETSWRSLFKKLWVREIAPEEILWCFAGKDSHQGDFFGEETDPRDWSEVSQKIGISAELMRAFDFVCLHRQEKKWPLLYRLFWRSFKEKKILEHLTDPDVLQLFQFQKQITRDIHKMHAFVRFKKIEREDGLSLYVAWYVSDHLIFERASTFFCNRFGSMHWAILGPSQQMYWNQEKLFFSNDDLPDLELPEDRFEDLWKTYYANIFNPARLKIKAMKNEMPVRFWKNLPEADLIPSLILDSDRRVQIMREKASQISVKSKLDISSQASLSDLASLVQDCRRCELCLNGTRAVFGEGQEGQSKFMIVGEAPGDREEQQGQVFVGPAGRLLRSVLSEIDWPVSQTYFTNAVKHFSFKNQNQRRIHQTPRPEFIESCRDWLEEEIQRVRPSLVVALGATAAKSLLGHSVPIQKNLGKLYRSFYGPEVVINFHPSHLLRSAEKKAERISQFKKVFQRLSG